MELSDAIPDFLAAQRESAADDEQAVFLQLEDLWERKLWHELTEVLVEFFESDASAPHRIPLYEHFIANFAGKINQLRLVQLGLRASDMCKDDRERLTFVNRLASKVDKPASQDAFVYATVASAGILLKLDEHDEARAKLDACERVLDGFDSVETIVHASFYKTNADYYRVTSDFAAYYRTALLYLACVDNLDADLAPQERAERAYNLAIAALASDRIYNFGELLLHPILNSLTGADAPQDNQWLRDLLFAFNRGDLRAFDALSNNIGAHPLLGQRTGFLREKMCLAALTEAVFKRPPAQRALTFSAISDETSVSEKDIEHLVMRALSLGLVRGTIDQVAQVARIQWVQPKVLDMGQIESMRGRLREWDGSVNALGTWIEGVGRDVWAA
ncbi:hypothetical protein BDY21DRAFT_337894 [Lineolata rhizophorae]|uniref:PCI domain-containing protein n=1 Tax=Lineolata rhizophorae TaxID=578093 RepID=A0A6A6P5M7_9PEZI|nr:hypothetical protein BDY21DRAFT_337894 [Lineolata rhizophorae]